MHISWKRLLEAAWGCLAGVALGDAMGMPVEMLPPDEIRGLYGRVRGFVRAPDFHPHHILEPGTVTDDAEQTLFVVKLLVEKRAPLSAEDFASALVEWAKRDNLLEKHYFGPSTRQAVQKLMEGVPAREAGGLNTTCGAAMRASPVGIVNACRPEMAAEEAAEISLPTHGSRVATSAASAVAAAVAEAVRSGSTIDSIVEAAVLGATLGFSKGKPVAAPSVAKRIKLAVDLARRVSDPEKAAEEIYDVVGTGIESAEAVPAAFGMLVAGEGRPMRVIELAVNAGGDTDTVASIAGAIAGAWRGISAFDAKMLEEVEAKNRLDLRNIAESLARAALSRLERFF
ncbi:MAG TPA: ADP-ribosylglycohydrolase family protein [Candidatus Korarchaeota archaeon]|nr:ADP-ribosylglycohydrolase family protein [Candidatus Korarchaeota archaeon]